MLQVLLYCTDTTTVSALRNSRRWFLPAKHLSDAQDLHQIPKPISLNLNLQTRSSTCKVFSQYWFIDFLFMLENKMDMIICEQNSSSYIIITDNLRCWLQMLMWIIILVIMMVNLSLTAYLTSQFLQLMLNVFRMSKICAFCGDWIFVLISWFKFDRNLTENFHWINLSFQSIFSHTIFPQYFFFFVWLHVSR